MINYVYLKQSLPNINFSFFSFILAETHIMKKKHTQWMMSELGGDPKMESSKNGWQCEK